MVSVCRRYCEEEEEELKGGGALSTTCLAVAVVLEALDVEAQHGRQPPDRHLLYCLLLLLARPADPAVCGPELLRAHVGVEAPDQRLRHPV